VGFVYHPAASPHVEVWHAAQETAPYLGFELVGLPVRTVPEIEAGMTGFAAAGAGNAGVVAPHAPTLGSRMLITGLASRYRLRATTGTPLSPAAAVGSRTASTLRASFSARPAP
jgi:hypothetical protein